MILLVSNSTHNIWHFRRALWQRLLAEGFPVHALAPIDDSAESLRRVGITVHALDQLQAQRSQPWDEFLLIKQLFTSYRQLRPDLILHFTIKPNIYGSWVARWLGVPAIANITGLGTTALSGPLVWRRTAWLYRIGLRQTEVIVCQNSDDQKQLQNAGVQAQQWVGIPGSGIDLAHYSYSPKAADEPLRFLFLGRILIDKGLRELLAAWKVVASQLPEAELQLAGAFDPTHPHSLPPEEWRAAQELPGLQYLGQVKDVRPHLRACQALVLPSYREGLPRAILEAMAIGRPVIAFDVPGCNALVEHGKTGQLLPPRDDSALVQAILDYGLRSNEEINGEGQAARQKVEAGFSAAHVSDLYLALVKELLEKS